MPEHILKSHNKTLPLYHIVCPVKYRRKAISEEVSKTIKSTCLEIGDRYDVHFIEIGTDDDHVHFLVQSVPTMTVAKIVTTIKSFTGHEVFDKHPDVKKMLWGGKFWTAGFYANTVGQYGNEQVISNYVKQQGKEYRQLHRDQPTLFDF